MKKTSDDGPIVVWLRRDLRIADNIALFEACQTGRPVVLLFILPEQQNTVPLGGASRWWLHHSLKAFNTSLEPFGQRLIVREGDPLEQIRGVLEHTDSQTVYWNRSYQPAERDRDERVYYELRGDGCVLETFPGSLLSEPWTIKTNAGDPYQVFTPFWKSCLKKDEFIEPVAAPDTIRVPDNWPDSVDSHDWQLEPKRDWKDGLAAAWTPGEQAALEVWKQFLDDSIGEYEDQRNLPAINGTSRLSPYLHFGEISPRQIYFEAQKRLNYNRNQPRIYKKNVDVFLSEIGWREFGYYVLYHFPHTADKPLREKFAEFSWEDRPDWLTAWQKGQTGYPIVDAGMRQLYQTGWMHNRVRMIVASFLTKDLLIHWKEGADWFHDTLVDADLASNTLGWQWASGCGADAAPYFRIFNPYLQSKKFDPDGKYLREWCPELADLPTKHLHEPSAAPRDVLHKAGITLGKDYPEPIVDHSEQRKQALELYDQIK